MLDLHKLHLTTFQLGTQLTYSPR